MNPIDNRHVERIVSLLVVLYGLWLLGSCGAAIVQNVIVYGWNVSAVVLVLSQIIVGCCLLIFFPFIVRWAGYFATKERNRLERRWFAAEIVALPVILYVFAHFLYVLYSCLQVIMSTMFSFSCCGDAYAITGKVGIAVVIALSLLVYIAVVAAVLFYARRIAAWLLRVAD